MSDHTFICYAREDRDFTLKVTEYLRGRGIPVWLDTWNIEPGTDWDRAIEESLRTCASVVIVLSPSSVISNEVRGELRTALNGGKFIVPLLYQPCEIPRQIQHLQYVDFSGSEVTGDAALEHLALVLLKPPEPDPHLRPAFPVERELRNRRAVLDDVRGEARDRLTQTLDSGAPLAILTEMQPHQVVRPWDGSVKMAIRPRPAMPAAIGIVEAFDAESVAGRLLILGAPGSGKTTALLQLAQELVRRAEHDHGEPMPMLLNLSSWRDDTRTFNAWLVEQLKRKYGVRQDYGLKWLDEREVVPLLDGLDELPPARHDACVRAINQFQQDFRPKYLVVCCRLAEYENVTAKLQLNGAICLLPLRDEQVHDYLVRAGCGSVWQSIASDLESMDLARSPLLLRMMTVAYGELSPDQWRQLATPSERRAYLLDVYTQHLASRDPAGGGYGQKQTRAWLARLAAVLARDGQEEFLLERMQPVWLQTVGQRWLYRAGVLASVGLLYFLAGELSDFLIGRAPQGPMRAAFRREYASIIPSRAADLVIRLLIVLSIGAFVATRKTIVPVETLRWSGTNAWRGTTRSLRRAAAAAMGYGLYVGLAVGVIVFARGNFGANFPWTAATSGWVRSGLVAGAAVGLLLVVALGMVPTPSAALWQRIRMPLTMRAADALMSGLLVAAAGSLVSGPAGVLAGTAVALIAGLSRGLTPASAGHFARALMVAFIGCLGIALQFARSSPEKPVTHWMGIWLSNGIGFGATAGLLSATFTRLRQTSGIADAPGPGINVPAWLCRRWGRWLLFGLVAAAMVAIACAALAQFGGMPVVTGIALVGNYGGGGLSLMLAYSLTFALTIGTTTAIMGGFLGALYGLLQGVTGPDIERRTVPNQGIRQSAANVAAFALIGLLAVGLPYGFVNVMSATIATGMAPGFWDWWQLGFGSAIWWGLIGGLVPGAACIQHFTLRFVLWCYGMAPWRYVRFLNYVTDQLLLQRVGGRYRFLHVLLRDHFAGIEPPIDAVNLDAHHGQRQT